MDILTTDRLILRPFEDADVAAYTAIRLKPGVTRFLPSHSDDPAEAAARAAATVAAFRASVETDGYGPWAVEERASGRLIGHLGLRWLAEMGETELLFLLDPQFQGRGYATEGARTALAHGFGPLGLTRIVAFALPSNTQSLAVLTRAGLRRLPGMSQAFGLEVVRFELTADQAAT